MCDQQSKINIKNPAAVLNLTLLNGKPPHTRLDVEEAMDTILMHWSDDLADNEGLRASLCGRIAEIVYPHLEGA